MKRTLLLLIAIISLSVTIAASAPASAEQMEMLQRRSQFTNGGIAMVVCIGALLVFLVVNNRWQHRLEVEKKNERKGKIRRVVAGILCAIGAGAVGYSVYADYRNGKFKATTPKLPEDATVKAEGEVK